MYFYPGPALTPYIHHYWILKSSCPFPSAQRIMPAGCTQMIFHRKKRIYSSHLEEYQPQSFLGGQTVTFEDLHFIGDIEMIVVVFRPHAVRLFFRLPMDELTGKAISVDELDVPGLKDLSRDVISAESTWESIRFIEDYLMKRFPSPDINFDRLTSALGLLNGNPATGITAMAGACCLSPKQFKRIFNEYVGVNPKEFQRIIRFQRAIKILETHPSIQLQDVAFHCGYYDQPHLTREFKLFTGYSPSDFLNQWDPHSDYFQER